jgi:hypothetical protein
VSLFRALAEGWLFGSLECGATQIRSGVAVVALLSDRELAMVI